MGCHRLRIATASDGVNQVDAARGKRTTTQPGEVNLKKDIPKYHMLALHAVSGPGVDEALDKEGQFLGHLGAWHKSAWAGSKYCVPNEYIAAELGRFLRLPIPGFTIAYLPTGDYVFSSLHFNFNRSEQLPPIDASATWGELPILSTGIVLFDVLIANADRHVKNLVADDPSKPRMVEVFDHDQSLFGGYDTLRGSDRLSALMNRLGISAGPVTKGNKHCFIDVMDASLFVDQWLGRIKSIPDWFIKDVCEKAGGYGLTRTEVYDVIEFLRHRRDSMESILEDGLDEFPCLDSWPWSGGLFK
ncbi:MAG: hypothetical protein Fues2KO_51940 [Fuerstiella sp.]